MTRVSNTDQVLLLLREQLQRMDRSRSARGRRVGPSDKGTVGPLARLQGSTVLNQLSEDDFRRTLVHAVLTEELGERIANDPAFQVIANDVFRILSESEDGRDLIERAARQVRSDD